MNLRLSLCNLSKILQLWQNHYISLLNESNGSVELQSVVIPLQVEIPLDHSTSWLFCTILSNSFLTPEDIGIVLFQGSNGQELVIAYQVIP